MFYDYYGFPEHTYHLTWPAPGSPDVARRVDELLRGLRGLLARARELVRQEAGR
jgi:aromatic ring-opening dioxygenase catalytic subunit (LigB family)